MAVAEEVLEGADNAMQWLRRGQPALGGAVPLDLRDGARLYGGRWNPSGVPVVYASESRALAVLETFVHLTLEARSMRLNASHPQFH